MSKKDVLKKILNDMMKYRNKGSLDLLKEAFCTIKPSKTRNIFIFILIIFLTYPIELIINSDNTINIVKDYINLTNGIIIDMFAILFTGYALFQALINRNTLKIMFLSKGGNKNILFVEYNLYFFIMCIGYVSSILTNYILLLVFEIIDRNTLTIMNETKIVLWWIFIILYLYVHIFLITEIKSFIVNLYKCFNISAISTMIDALPSYDENLHEIDHNEINSIEQIKELALLRDSGIITIDEFELKKKELLNKIQ